jgi:PAS domain-containing protein
LAVALQHSEQIGALLRTKIDTMMDPRAMIEPIRDSHGTIIDFVCVDANRAACREFGLRLEELLGRRHLPGWPRHPIGHSTR